MHGTLIYGGFALLVLLIVMLVRSKFVHFILKFFAVIILVIIYIIFVFIIGTLYVAPVSKSDIKTLESIASAHGEQIAEIHVLMSEYYGDNAVTCGMGERDLWEPRAHELASEVLDAIRATLAKSGVNGGCEIVFYNDYEGTYLKIDLPVWSARLWELYYLPFQSDPPHESWKKLNTQPHWYYYSAPFPL